MERYLDTVNRVRRASSLRSEALEEMLSAEKNYLQNTSRKNAAELLHATDVFRVCAEFFNNEFGLLLEDFDAARNCKLGISTREQVEEEVRKRLEESE